MKTLRDPVPTGPLAVLLVLGHIHLARIRRVNGMEEGQCGECCEHRHARACVRLLEPDCLVAELARYGKLLLHLCHWVDKRAQLCLSRLRLCD